nr:hypothetical protein GCM10020092_048480 [Actinoplanes digitatis]
MNIEHQLKMAFEKKEMGEESRNTTKKQFEDFESERKKRSEAPACRSGEASTATSARYGIAAYFVGVHLAACGHLEEAATWLKEAAERDIGDSAFRLAKIYETQAVTDFNRQFDFDDPLIADTEEKFSEAYYWYHKAASAGYARQSFPGGEALDDPVLSLDCCSGVRAVSSEEAAARLLLDSRLNAERMIRDAREDVCTTIRMARTEIRDLSLEHQRLTAEVVEHRKTLNIFRTFSG